MRSSRQVAKEEAAAEAKKKADEAAEARKRKAAEAEEAEELKRKKNALIEIEWRQFGATLDCERSIANRPMFRKSQMMKNAEKWLIDNKAKIEEYETWKRANARSTHTSAFSRKTTAPKKSIAKKPLAAKNRWVIAPSPDKSDAFWKSQGLVNLSKPMSKGARKAAVMRMALDSDSD